MSKFLKQLFLFLSVTLISMSSALANVATVDMGKLFKEYDQTKEVQKRLEADTEVIRDQDEKKAKVIQQLADQMKKIQDKAAEPSATPADKEKYQRQIQYIVKQGNAAEKRRQIWRGQRMRAIQENYVTEVKKLLSQIRDKVSAYAKEKGITKIYDKSARGTAQTKILLFSKDKFDITSDLLKTLNDTK